MSTFNQEVGLRFHFLPTDFYNFWGNYRTLKEGAAPSVFSFPTKKSAPRRKLVRVGNDESNEEGPVQEDKLDNDPETTEALSMLMSQ